MSHMQGIKPVVDAEQKGGGGIGNNSQTDKGDNSSR